MGLGIMPVFNPRVRGAALVSDGKLLLREFEALDGIADDLGLTRFSAFGDNRELPEDFEGDPEELGEALGEWDEWFSIDEGLKTIDGIAQALKDNEEFVARLEEAEEVRDELETLAECLRTAREKGAQFRLEVA